MVASAHEVVAEFAEPVRSLWGRKQVSLEGTQTASARNFRTARCSMIPRARYHQYVDGTTREPGRSPSTLIAPPSPLTSTSFSSRATGRLAEIG